MPIIFTISLKIHILSLILIDGLCAKYEKRVEKIQALGKLINEKIRKILSHRWRNLDKNLSRLPNDETEEG